MLKEIKFYQSSRAALPCFTVILPSFALQFLLNGFSAG